MAGVAGMGVLRRFKSGRGVAGVVAVQGEAGEAWPGTARRGWARSGAAGVEWHGTAKRDRARFGRAGKEWHGVQRIGASRLGKAGKARIG